MAFDYVADGQMNIFDFLQTDEPKTEFNPIEEYALHGTGFVNGKKRVIEFFRSNSNLKDRADFLKKEYGIGGFGSPCDKPFVVHGGGTIRGSEHEIEYYNENMQNVVIKVSNSELAKVIASLILSGRYKAEKE